MWVLDVESESMSLHLVQGEWTLGRSGNVFNFPKDKSISRSHAEFQVGGLEDLENVAELPSFVLIDKKSRFGTYLNDVQVNPNTPMPLRAGDKISFGAKSTILRVRYLKMKANRKKLLEGCKAIGMHHVTAAVDDVNYCITDSGKFVATEKVLWAMVHNHPIVSSEWVQAVLRRKSMAEELPSCEAFLPQPDALSATEVRTLAPLYTSHHIAQTQEKVLPSYSPDPRRFSLYSNFQVVFLTPSSMESLLPVMGGEVFPAYTSHESDEFLVDYLRKSSRDHHRQAPVENPEETEVCIGAAVVVFEPLVVRRSSSQGTPAHHNEGIDITAHVRYLPRNTASLRPPPPSTAYNAKKFRKNHVVAMPVRRRLVTKFTNVVPVNLEHRREFARQDEELEARERLAEALFTSNMPGTNKTGSRSRR
ncbi:hypothetical protein DYB32_004130 [Aphanomyces invadans]|uniref:FHA domain-containing protein n=1 Tax=Aphanomyces invadans TaxID=157072 RepID=A0A418B1C3_9STRA|nr:hypothetical protein DYB32_004130 [Aphanomyces invadans]